MTTAENTQPQAQTHAKSNQAKPNQGNQQRRTYTPLSESDLAEINTAVSRSSGLGRIVLNVIRNRNARVIVTETAIGEELLTHAIELDRMLDRMGNRLTRNLNVEDMQKKSALELKAAEFIQPLRNITAEMALDFDDPHYSVIHHPETKKLVQALKAAKKKTTENPKESLKTSEAA